MAQPKQTRFSDFETRYLLEVNQQDDDIEQQQQQPTLPEEDPPSYSSYWTPHGYQVYRNHYPEEYDGYRGCCSMPCAFIFLILGIICFPLNIVFFMFGAMFVFSKNPYEVYWAKICGVAILIIFILTLGTGTAHILSYL